MTTLAEKDLQDIVEQATNGTTRAKPKKRNTKPAVTTPEFEEHNAEDSEGTKYSELFGWDSVVLKNKDDFIVEVFNDTERVPDVDPHRS